MRRCTLRFKACPLAYSLNNGRRVRFRQIRARRGPALPRRRLALPLVAPNLLRVPGQPVSGMEGCGAGSRDLKLWNSEYRN